MPSLVGRERESVGQRNSSRVVLISSTLPAHFWRGFPILRRRFNGTTHFCTLWMPALTGLRWKLRNKNILEFYSCHSCYALPQHWSATSYLNKTSSPQQKIELFILAKQISNSHRPSRLRTSSRDVCVPVCLAVYLSVSLSARLSVYLFLWPMEKKKKNLTKQKKYHQLYAGSPVSTPRYTTTIHRTPKDTNKMATTQRTTLTAGTCIIWRESQR